MPKEIELWQFIADHLRLGENVVLLVVAESHGSSPGRAGYKMAVAANGDLVGSIGGGVMEVNLVERARAILSESPAVAGGLTTQLVEQEHRKNSEHPSGMICSGRQTVILVRLQPNDYRRVRHLPRYITGKRPQPARYLRITSEGLSTIWTPKPRSALPFSRDIEGTNFQYEECLFSRKHLFIFGGGHCSLALSELTSRMDFRIHIFDDRPSLNTLEKNQFADEITIVDTYGSIGPVYEGENVYVVVMTLGYKTDAIVIRQLLGKQFKYFGVLGSKAKMATLLRELKSEGYPEDQLDAIRTPIGIPINSRTPEEIAVSIAAEIVLVKNA